MRRKHTDHAKSSRVELPLDPNPLVRRSDRLQSRAKSIVVTLMIVMLPLSAWFGMTTLSNQKLEVSAQQYSRHAVTATTTSATDATPLVQSDFNAQNNSTVDATWAYGNVDHQGQVSVTIGSPVGTEVDIWVDNSGARAMPPISDADAAAAGLFTGIGSLLTIWMILYGAYAALRFHLDTKRESDWDLAIRNFMDENSLS